MRFGNELENKNLLQQKGTIRSNGRRLTSQRTLLLDIINRADNHLDADELHRLAKEKDPRISLSTVYRTLSLLKRLNMVEELHLAEEHHHYEARSKKEHHHLVCLRCGRVIEFRSHLTQKLAQHLSQTYGFHVVATEIDVSGICNECQNMLDRENDVKNIPEHGSGGSYER